ncbi:hypothetical protein AAK938_01185 [Aerococcaceae bacterium 50-4]
MNRKIKILGIMFVALIYLVSLDTEVAKAETIVSDATTIISPRAVLPNEPGSSAPSYFFNRYVHVHSSRYSNKPSETKIWQVAYSNGKKYQGWVYWTGKSKVVSYGVRHYEFRGSLHRA